MRIDTELGKKLRKEKNSNEILHNFLQQNAIAIYTDGSKSSRSMAVGVACICPELNVELAKTVNKITSVFTAECMAISTAMDLVLNYSDTNFLILSDSLSALLSLQSHNFSFTTNPHILEIKNKYVCFKRKNPNCTITFNWK